MRSLFYPGSLMQEHLVDRVKTERGRTQFLKKIGKDERFIKMDSKPGRVIMFFSVDFLSGSTTALNSVVLISVYFILTIVTGLS